jgi:hypothetical protein
MLYVVLNAVLAIAVVGGVVGLLTWSVLTQHRQPRCEAVRVTRRRAPTIRAVAPVQAPERELTTFLPSLPNA